MSILRRLTFYGTLNTSHGLVVTVTTAVSTALLYRSLGGEYGLLALIASGMVRFNLVDDSLGTFVVATVSEARGGRDRRLALGIRLYLILAILLGTGFALAVGALLHRRSDVALLALLAGCGLLLSTLASLPAKLLEGREEYLRLRLAQSSIATLRLAGIAVLFALGVKALESYVVLFVASYLLLLVLLALLVAPTGRIGNDGGRERTAPRHAGVETELADIGRFVRPLLVAKGASVVSYRLDLWVVQALVGPAATTAYAMAEAVAGLAAQSIEVFKALLPISIRDWQERRSWIRKLVLDSSKLTFLVVGGLCAVAAAAAPPILELWFGVAPPLAVLVLRLLLLFYALTSFRSAIQILLIGQGLFGELEKHFVRAAGINLLVSVAATVWFGGWGAAVGTVVAGVYLLLANIRSAERVLDLRELTLARRLVLPGLMVLVGAVTTAWWIQTGGVVSELLVRAAVTGGTFLTLSWFCVLDREERARTYRVLRRTP